jgi:hypothetical protein
MGEVRGEPEGQRCFVLQALDPLTGCPVLEARVQTGNLDALRMALGVSADEDPDFDYIYDLVEAELDAISHLLDLSFPRDLGPVRLVSWSALREVPYLVHTEYELALMLEGRKPLAVFSGSYPSEWFEELIARFEPYVAEGRFVRRIIDEPFPKPRMSEGERIDGVRRVYIALPDEQWRIDAYIQLFDDPGAGGWDEARERRQGRLLGYEEWQCDWWGAHRPGKT